MKSMFLALAVFSSAALTSTAQAAVSDYAAVYWTCNLSAVLTQNSSSEFYVARAENVIGEGSVSCVDLAGRQKSEQRVQVTLKSFGVGLAFNGPISAIKIDGLAKGVSRVDAMIGKYSVTGGVRVGWINSRRSYQSGWQYSGGFNSAAKIDAVVEDRESYLADASFSSVQVVALEEPIVTRY